MYPPPKSGMLSNAVIHPSVRLSVCLSVCTPKNDSFQSYDVCMCLRVSRTSADAGDLVEIISVTITIEADLAILG